MASRYEAEYIWPILLATAPTRDVGWRYCYFALTIVNQLTNSTYNKLLVANAGIDLKDKSDYNPYRAPIPDFSDLSLEEQDALIKKDPAWGKIVCRCETVPEGEIIAAIHSTLGARTVEGVKRRTRAGMGRCQSGFCQYKVMQILSRELGIPEEQVLFEEQGAQVLYGKIKG